MTDGLVPRPAVRKFTDAQATLAGRIGKVLPMPDITVQHPVIEWRMYAGIAAVKVLLADPDLAREALGD